MSSSQHWTPLVVAFVATVAMALQVSGGFHSSFVRVTAKTGEILSMVDSNAQEAVTATSIGVMGDGSDDFYRVGNDRRWIFSRVFLSIAMLCGGVALVVAWAISIAVPPTKRLWQIVSIASALAAVTQVPVFLIFAAFPCTDYEKQQTCQISTGAVLFMAGLIVWLAVTVLTQFLDPPLGVPTLDHWRTQPKSHQSASQGSRTRGAVTVWDRLRAGSRRTEDRRPILPINVTESISDLVEEAVHSSFADDGPLPFQRSVRSETPNDAYSHQASTRNVRSDELPDEEQAPVQGISLDHASAVADASLSLPVKKITPDESILDHDSLHSMLDNDTELHDAKQALPVFAVDTGNLPTASESIYKLEVNGKRCQPSTATGILGFAHKRRVKRTGAVKGYDVLEDDGGDDDNNEGHLIGSSQLNSCPPLEIVTIQMQPSLDETADDDSHWIDVHDTNGKGLLNVWNMLHDLQASEPIEYSAAEETIDFLSEGTTSVEKPLLREIPTNVDDKGFLIFESSAEFSPPPENSVGTRRRSRRRRSRGPHSVCSSPSLLHVTIEEETAEDLEEHCLDSDDDPQHDKPLPLLTRTRSAPNLLASYIRSKNRSNVAEDLHMTGIHSFHRVENYRSEYSKANSLTDASKRDCDSHCKENSRAAVPVVSPRLEPKQSVWRDERHMRRGIHETETIVSTDSSDHHSLMSSPSPTSRRASRIRRLQQVQIDDKQSLRRRSRTLDPPKKRNSRRITPVRSSTQSVVSDPGSPNCRSRCPVSPNADQDTAATSEQTRTRSTGRVSPDLSFITTPSQQSLSNHSHISYADSGLVDTLNLSLAELHRPYDNECSPEEGSV